MKKKKISLADAFGKSTAKTVETANVPKAEDSSSEIKSNIAPSRVNKKAVTGFFEPEVSKQLKLLAIEQETTLQALLVDAINDIFKKYNKSPIAH